MKNDIIIIGIKIILMRVNKFGKFLFDIKNKKFSNHLLNISIFIKFKGFNKA